MTKLHRSLFVIEGPAGAGKSTLIQHFLDRYLEELQPATPLISFDRPRSYSGEEGLLLSQIKDYQTTVRLVSGWGPYERGTAFIADRWYLSQLIYGSIRNGHGGPEPSQLHLGLLAAARAVHYGDLEYRARYPVELTVQTIYRIHFMILIPSLGMLVEQREKAGRDFPYDPRIEQRAYGELTIRLGCLGHQINRAGLENVWMYSSFWGFDSVKSRDDTGLLMAKYIQGELGWLEHKNSMTPLSEARTSTWNPG